MKDFLWKAAEDRPPSNAAMNGSHQDSNAAYDKFD